MDKRLLNQVFDSVVMRRGKATAIVDGLRTINYEHLGDFSNAIANALLSNGCGRGSVTAVFLEEGIDYIASILGVMKSGGVFMPVNPEFPAARNAAILAKSEPLVLITKATFTDRLVQLLEDLSFRPTILVLPEVGFDATGIEFTVDGIVSAGNFEKPNVEQDGDDSCYIIHTSGTTGEPKAILGRHKGLSHFIHWEIGEFGLDENCAIPLFAPPTFDVSLRDIFAPLISGGTVYSPPDDSFRNLGQLVDWIDRSDITLMHIVPSLFRLVLSELESRGTEVEKLFLNLRNVLLAGEPLMGRDINRWKRLFGERIEPVNLYGPSESTLAKCFNRLAGKEFIDEKVIPVGNPISNTAVLILKENKLCPVGSIGEVHIKTPFLTKGYYRDEELTRQSFIQNPLSETPDIIYKTGDQGRYLPDRQIELLGRMDRQVKVNGNRIELEDVEAAALKYSGIDQCYVGTVTRNELMYLVCYYTTGSAATSDSLRSHLHTCLPDYAVPSFFVKLDQFPLSLNGKVDKRKLPRPEELLYASIPYEPPCDEIEEKLTQSWAQILGLPKVGVNNPFFDLGGTSLTAIKLTSEIFGQFNVNITLREILQNPTVRNLAAMIKVARGDTSRFEIKLLEEREFYPISAGQRRIWFLNQLPGGETINNMPGAWKIHGVLDYWLMERCFNQVIERHESLRTGFMVVDGEPVQIVHQKAPIKFNLSIPPVDVDREAHIRDVFRSEAKHPFDLTKPPLARCQIIMTAEEESIAIITVHHIIADGVSLDLIANELFRLYRDAISRKATSLEPLLFHYKDYSAWQKEFLVSPAGKAQETYWKDQFKEKVESIDFPLDYPRRSMQTFSGRTVKKTLPDPTFRFLSDLARSEGASLFSVITALVKTLLYRYTGQTDLTIGTAVAGRDHPELSYHVGLFANLVALRDRIDSMKNFREFLQQVRKTVENSLVHQSYPYDHLVEGLEIERSMSRSPLFDITIALQEDTQQTAAPEDITVETLEMDWEMTRYDLMFTFKLRADSLLLDIAYNSDLFSADSMEYLWEHLNTLCGSISDHPSRPISELSLVSAAEHETIRRFSLPVSDPTVPESVIHPIEMFAATDPDRPALSDGKRSITYSQLHRLTNGVANQLLSLSLKRETIVGVMMERGLEPVIIQIGVMRAGLAFMPLDPTHPLDRRQTILRQSGCRHLVTIDGSVDTVIKEELDRCLSATDLIEEHSAAPDIQIKAGDLAYVLFTSGSTGTPKGALIEHGGLANSILGMARAFGVTPLDRGLQFANLVFDASVCEIYTTLTRGATLFTLTQREVDNTDLLIDYLHANRITYVVLPPVLVQSFNRRELPCLRVMVTAGDSPYPEDVRFYRATADYINAYGPTECSICISTHRVEDDDLKRLRIPIGSPIPNLAVRILDDQLHDQPVGVPGELFAVGTGVGRGYVNDSTQTARAFVTLPDAQHLRSYRTGDRARWLPDGSLEYLGRIDRQVKIRGYRIEIGEVEEALAMHPAVSQAAVLDLKEAEGRLSLAAFYTPRSFENKSNTEELSNSSIRRFLGKRLPEYMIPQHFVEIGSLPLTSSGKIDRRQLEKAFLDRSTPLKVDDRMGSDSEELVRSVWQGVLGRDTIGLDDDFFAVGGDSIKAIQIVARLHQLGYRISVADVFEQSCVAGVAAVMSLADEPLNEEAVVGTIPLTPIQLWFFQLHGENPHHFHQSSTLKSSVRIDEHALRKTLDELAYRHDMLRAVYPIVDGIRTQEVLPGGEASVDLQLFDLRDSSDIESILHRGIEDLHRSIRIDQPPLAKVGLFRLPDYDLIHVAIHHLIVDGISWRILMDDFQSIYNARLQGLNDDRPVKSTSFKSWSEKLEAYVGSELLLNQLPFWIHLEDIASCLPVGDSDSPGASIIPVSQFETCSGSLSAQGTGRFRTAIASHALEMDTFLLAALLNALHAQLGRELFSVQLEGHGRDVFPEGVDVSRTIGWFTSTFPITIRLSRPGISECLSEISTARQKIPTSGTGYGILRYLSCSNQQAAAALRLNPGIRFNYLGSFDSDFGDGEFISVDGYNHYDRSPESPVDVDLSFEAAISGKELRWRIDYNRSIYTPEQIEAVMSLIQSELTPESVLQSLTRMKQTSVSTISEADFEGIDLG